MLSVPPNIAHPQTKIVANCGVDAAAPAAIDLRPRVLVVYQYIALYRLPVFSELSRSTLYNFDFMSGTTGNGETPKLASEAQLQAATFPWKRATNSWLPASLLWQNEAFLAALGGQYDAFIFLGDMHYLSTWAGAVAAKMRGKKTLFWTIGMHRPERGQKLLLRNLWHSMPDHLLVYGEYAKNLMIAGGVASSKISIIGNSLDFELQSRIYENLENAAIGANAVPTLVSVGRATHRRKLDLLIRAVACLRDENVPLKLRLIGDGSALDALKELVRTLDVANEVEFLGAIYREEEIAREIYQADLCVVPGIIGLGAIHAHTYGTPVITCGDWDIQAPEAEVIVPGVTGEFCKWNDLASLKTVISSWLGARRRREEIRLACRRAIARKWTPTRQRAVVEHALQSLLPMDGKSNR